MNKNSKANEKPGMANPAPKKVPFICRVPAAVIDRGKVEEPNATISDFTLQSRHPIHSRLKSLAQLILPTDSLSSGIRDTLHSSHITSAQEELQRSVAD